MSSSLHNMFGKNIKSFTEFYSTHIQVSYKRSLSKSPNESNVRIPAGQNGLVLSDLAALRPKKIALKLAMKAATLISLGFSCIWQAP